jgi:isoleucyl-tRNA synthetase
LHKLVQKCNKTKIKKIEDKWILSRYNNLIKNVTDELENLHPQLATKFVLDFWLNDLSRGYIQFIRERLSNDDNDANFVLNLIYLGLLKLCAPIIPFTTEKIWQNLKDNEIIKEESVHLSFWPKYDEKLINKKLEEQFNILAKIVEIGLKERDKVQIGLKWPLNKAIITCPVNLGKELENLIKIQLNVKSLEIKKNKEIKLKLDTEIRNDLVAEGYSREISRKIQDSRKKAGFVKTDNINLGLILDSEIYGLLKRYKENLEFIKTRVNAKELKIDSVNEKDYKNIFEDKVKGKIIKILFNKVDSSRYNS